MSLPRGSKRSSSSLKWPHLILVAAVVVAGLTMTLRGVDILSIVAAATSSLTRSPVTLYLTPYEDSSFIVGDVKKVDVIANSHVPINAIGATIKFPQDSLEVLGFSKEKSFFDLWTEETAIKEDVGEIHFSGGTTVSGGMIGTGTVLTLTVRAKKSGEAKISFKDSEVYAADGEGTLLGNELRSMTFAIKDPTPVHVAASSETQPYRPLPRNPDVNTDSVVNLVDVSIMIMRLVMPYDYHFDLDMDGAITIGDVSIVLASIKK